MESDHHEVHAPALEMVEGGDTLEASRGEWGAVVALGRGVPVELAVEPVVVVVGREWVSPSAAASSVRKISRSSSSDWRIPQKRSILPFVQGEFTWVRMWRMRSSSRVLPRSARGWP